VYNKTAVIGLYDSYECIVGSNLLLSKLRPAYVIMVHQRHAQTDGLTNDLQ